MGHSEAMLTKLRYGLSTVWLVTSQRRRVDGFVARCLRRLLCIPAAYISRISNAAVLERAGAKAFSQQLLKHQLQLLRKTALTEAGDPLRKDTFIDSTLIPQIGRFVRRVGRPRQDWTSQVLREGRERFGHAAFETFMSGCTQDAERRWNLAVEKAFG